MLARIRIRRGYPGGEELLNRTRQTARRQDELSRLGPILAGLAESVWLRGGTSTELDEATALYRRARDAGHRSVAAELGYWLTKAGVGVELPPSDGHPYLPQAAGRWRQAGRGLAVRGLPVRAGRRARRGRRPRCSADLSLHSRRSRGGAAGPESARQASWPRRRAGPARTAPGTRENPAGLTERQLEVLRLLAQGLTNAEIARRLVVSVRTVDTHVAAVLDKLGAASRREAADRAAELGVSIQPSPQAR